MTEQPDPDKPEVEPPSGDPPGTPAVPEDAPPAQAAGEDTASSDEQGESARTDDGDADDVDPDDRPPERQKVAWWKSLLGLIVSAVLIYWVFFEFLPSQVDYSEAASALGEVDPLYWGGLIGTTVAWLFVTWWTIAVTLPGMRLREAVVSNLGSTTVNNTVPVVGGVLALGVNLQMYYSWGLPVDAYALGALVKGVWDNIVRFGLPGVALVLYLLFGDADLGPGWRPVFILAVIALVIVVITIAIVAAMVKRRDFAEWFAELANKVTNWVLRLFRQDERDVRPDVMQFRDNLTLAVTGQAVKITFLDLGYQLLMAGVLLVSLRAVGVDSSILTPLEVLLTFAVVRAATVIPITPGNVGIAETLYLTALTSLAGAGAPEGTDNLIAAAILIYRMLTYFLPILLGGGAYLFWTQNTSWTDSVKHRAWRESVPDLVGPGGRVS